MRMKLDDLNREYRWRLGRNNGDDIKNLPSWAQDLLEEQQRHLTSKVESPAAATAGLALDRLADIKETLSCITTDAKAYIREGASVDAKAKLHTNIITGLRNAERERKRLEADLGKLT